ncbi:MAG TPA: signal recognition particle-docking protein FtsY [Roseomonas sp.]|nr:signal recognition particle-docking protein FtsY [Roseomonas sp.]
MALRDLWAKLTGREKEKPAEEAAPPPETELQEEAPPAEPGAPPPPEAAQPAVTAPAPPETRSPDQPPAAPLPPRTTPVAPPEVRSPPPSAGLPPGDLPQVPTEVPPPGPPAGPMPPPEVSPGAFPEAPSREELPEQPAPPPAPSQAPPAPPGWQPPPAEQPIPVAPPTPAAPPPETPPLTPPAAPVAPPEVPAPPPVPESPPAEPPEPPAPERSKELPPAVTAFLPAEPEAVPEAPLEEPAARGGWFGRLRAGLSRSTARLTDGITGLFNKRKLDDAALEELEEALITADLGVAVADRIVTAFRRSRFGKEVTDQEVKEALATEIATILEPVAQPLELDNEKRPHVVLVVGVNGTGKTTTIAKLGQQWREEGRSVGFVAGDTFRAAAVEQLQIWGERTGCEVFAPAKEGADAAALAFDALKQAQAQGTEVLLVDTAGRLHNKTALMEELRKVVRVMQRVDPTAPHSVLLVLDATTGQNATQQCKVFSEMVQVTGLVVTKLDGSAKGGIVVALAQEFGLPVHAVGVGEKAADLRPFAARDFARSLLGLS